MIKSGLPRWLSGKEFACQCRRERETWVEFLCQEDPLEEDMAATQGSLPGESHGQRRLVGYSPWGCKESDRTEHTQYSISKGLTPKSRFRALIPLAKSIIQRTSLVVQWLRIPSKQGMQILYMVGELRSHLPWSN